MPNPDSSTPFFDLTDGNLVAARGNWQVHALAQPGVIQAIQARMKSLAGSDGLRWDLSQIGAQFLWNAWDKARPP